MKPPRLRVVRPATIEECLDQLAGGGESTVKVIAGGQSLMPLLALRLSAPDLLVDIGRLSELVALEVDARQIRIGGRVRHDQLAGPDVRAELPVLADAAGHIGHVAVRNRGTLGGSLAHADPAAELPGIMVLLRAEIECLSVRGLRLVPAAEFFLGPYGTVLEEDELIAGVRIPRPVADTGHGFVEFAPRHGDYARAGAACLVRVDEQGAVAAVRAALFAVESVPLDLSDAVAEAIGRPIDEIDWSVLADTAVRRLPAPQDADRITRHRLARVALGRALRQAAGRGKENVL